MSFRYHLWDFLSTGRMGESTLRLNLKNIQQRHKFFFFTNGKLLVTCFPQAGILLESSQLASQLSYFQRQKTDAPIQLHDVIQDELLASMCGFQRLEAVNMSIMCAEKKKPCICGHSMLAFFLSINRPSLFQKGTRNQSIFADQEKAGKAKGKVPGNLQCVLTLQSST